ncbi:MAG: hypothetical protein O7D34_00350 [Ignavibacteria bacterium]|nr:hypothetical protein [Ignavibacteria bacterium]
MDIDKTTSPPKVERWDSRREDPKKFSVALKKDMKWIFLGRHQETEKFCLALEKSAVIEGDVAAAELYFRLVFDWEPKDEIELILIANHDT